VPRSSSESRTAARQNGGGNCAASSPKRATSASWIGELVRVGGQAPVSRWSSSHCHWKNAASNSEVGVS
jgi:hypothetical protein